MRSVDIFGLALAVIIAGAAQIVDAWSPTWWVGMTAAGLVALVSGTHILWDRLPEAARSRISLAIWSPAGNVRGWIGLVLLCVVLGGGYKIVAKMTAPIPAIPLPQSRPADAPKEGPPPRPESPWVTKSEIAIQSLRGRSLVPFSPNQFVLALASRDLDLATYQGNWIKFSGDFWRLTIASPLPDKRKYFQVDLRGAYLNLLLFDVNKWQDRLIPLNPGQKIEGLCQTYGVVEHQLYLNNCEF